MLINEPLIALPSEEKMLNDYFAFKVNNVQSMVTLLILLLLLLLTLPIAFWSDLLMTNKVQDMLKLMMTSRVFYNVICTGF